MKRQRIQTIVFFIIIPFLLLAVANISFASNSNEIGHETLSIVKKFQEGTANWDTIIKGYTLNLFAILLTLDIAWMGINAALTRPQLPDFIKQIATTIFFAAIFLAVINHYKEWSWQIVSQFQDVAQKLSPEFISSSTPIEIGFGLCGKILANMSIWSPADSFVYAVAAFIILICFALLSAQIIFIKCEATLAMAAAMILLGFGGAGFTRDYAINAIRYVLAVAFKLFVISLLLGVGASFINDISSLTEPTYEELFVIIGAVVVLLALSTSLPDVCAGIINGSHVSSGMALVHTAGTVATMAIGAAFAGASGVGAAKAANTLANEEGKSGMGKALHMGKTLGKSAMQSAMDMPGHRMLKGMQSNMEMQLQQSRMRRAGQDSE